MNTLISVEHNEDRLAGTLFNLTRGPNPAKIRVYDDSGVPARPAAITDAPTGVLLTTIILKDPVGQIINNKLVLDLPDDAMVVANGRARWARVETGEGNPSMDIGVSDAAGTGQLKMSTIDLLAGGATRLISGVIG